MSNNFNFKHLFWIIPMLMFAISWVITGLIPSCVSCEAAKGLLTEPDLINVGAPNGFVLDRVEISEQGEVFKIYKKELNK